MTYVKLTVGYGLLPDGTKPSPESMMIAYWWGSVEFTWQQLYSQSPSYKSVPWISISSFKMTATSPRQQWVNMYMNRYEWHLTKGLLPVTQNCGLRMHRECWERFPRHRIQRKPPVSDPGMHYGTCVTRVPWCMWGSLTHHGGENVPGIPDACAICNFTYLARGPWRRWSILRKNIRKFQTHLTARSQYLSALTRHQLDTQK